MIDHFEADIAAVLRSNVKVRRVVVEFWYRAVAETLRERGIGVYPPPDPINPDDDHVVRWVPFWRGLPTGELTEVLERLRRFRPQSRILPRH
ncbi:hypothetical protein DM450_07650 [Sphingomonas sp. IC081]|nr:hypothetical protein DM450_07650 [Sphingomonas sp. IC081]